MAAAARSLLQRGARPGVAGGRAPSTSGITAAPARFVPSPRASAQLVDQALSRPIAASVMRRRPLAHVQAGDQCELPRIDESSQHLQQLFQCHMPSPTSSVMSSGSVTRSAAAPLMNGLAAPGRGARGIAAQEAGLDVALWPARAGPHQRCCGLYGGRTDHEPGLLCRVCADQLRPVSLSAERRTAGDRRAALRPAGATGVAHSFSRPR